MRICAVTSSFPKHRGDTSIGSFVFEPLKRLNRKGCNVYVVAPHEYGLAESENMDGIFVHRFSYMYPHYLQRLAYGKSIAENVKRSKMAVLQIPLYTLFCSLKTLNVIKLNRVDSIVAYWTLPQGFIGAILKTITKRSLILNTFPVELSLAISKYKFLIPLLRKTFEKADLIVANSNYTRKMIMSLGTRSEKIHVIYPGVDTSRYKNTRGDHTRGSLGFQDKLILLAVARLVKRKGIKYLIEAMPKILRAVPEAILVIVGDGPERDGLEEETRKLKLNGNVAFLGKVAEEELLRLYYASDVFVLPAIVDSDGNTEGLGVVLLEAMSMKKPVVASRVGGIPEAVIHNETGFLVEPGNSEELARAVTRILLDHQSSVEMGEKGRQRVEQMFDWNIIAADFSELLTGKRRNLKGGVLISAKEGAVEACTEVLC